MKIKRGSTALGFLGAVMVLAALLGCSAAHYRRSADKEVYGILQRVEERIYGHTNAFSIETVYSQRKPEELMASEFIENRLQSDRRVLTVERALELATQHSRDYQRNKEDLYRAALALSDARYQYKPILDAGGVFGANNATADNSVDVFTSANSRLSISQLLRSGGRLSASLANGMLRYYTGDPRRSIVTTLSVDLFQPLLRGFGRNNPDIEELTRAERAVVYAVRSYGYYQHEFALGIVNQYFDLLEQKDTIRNRYTNYLSRVESTKRVAERKDRERLVDVDQARQAELSAKNNYVDAVAAYLDALDAFKLRLGLPVGDKLYLDDQALEELEEVGLVPAPLDPNEAYRVAVEVKLPILNEIDRFEDAKRQVRIAADQLRADLNIFSGASYQFDETDDYTRFDADQIKWDAGVELNLPFDRLRQRNSYRRALIAFEAEVRSLTLTLDTLKNSIEQRLRALEQRRQNYQIQKNALELANRRVESTTLLLQAGRAEVRDLVEAQDAQISAQNAVTSAIVNYQQTRLQLMLDIGALNTDIPKFWLKDHLAGFMPRQPSVVQPPSLEEKPVFPPDQYFNN